MRTKSELIEKVVDLMGEALKETDEDEINKKIGWIQAINWVEGDG